MIILLFFSTAAYYLLILHFTSKKSASLMINRSFFTFLFLKITFVNLLLNVSCLYQILLLDLDNFVKKIYLF